MLAVARTVALTAALALMFAVTACKSASSSASSTGEALASYSSPYDKPGFVTHVEEGRLLVMRPGEEWSEKHVSLIGAGPGGMTVKALSRKAALEYLASKPGFDVAIEDGRLWVLRPGQEMSEKHVTVIGAGPQGMTVKAVDRDTLDAYLRP